MHVVDEPFTTREAILAVFRPGQMPTEAPFRTLRHHGQASEGVRVDVRNRLGRLLGRTNCYSVLNTDAARAARRNDPERAQYFATAAANIERSAAASAIYQVIQQVAASMPTDLDDPTASTALRRYIALRGASSPRGLDRDGLAREWVIRSAAWFDPDNRDLADAVDTLSRETAKARASVSGQSADWVSTFYGVVRRMDEFAVEVQGDAGTRLVPRSELDREGLAVIGQAVALLCEELPAGGSLVIPMPAVAVDQPSPQRGLDPWDVGGVGDGGPPISVLERADYDWVNRQRTKTPTKVRRSRLPKA